MSTSTIEKILLSLSKQSDDKKVILNNRYVNSITYCHHNLFSYYFSEC